MIKDYTAEIQTLYRNELLDEFIAGNNKVYNQALEDKKMAEGDWNNLIALLKLNNYFIRDISAASHLHINKLLLGFDGLKNGIALSISYLPKYIGLYYYHQTAVSSVPLTDRAGNRINSLSYFPFNRDQVILTKQLLNLLPAGFTYFNLFNNVYADTKVFDVIMDNTLYKESDLFHVLFDDTIPLF